MQFRSNKKIFSAIKLYTIGEAQASIARERLISAVLEIFEVFFGEYPEHFDIHGPYGIKKGQTVSLDNFKKRLDKASHEKYYALDGYSEGNFGFHLQLRGRLGRIAYTELIVWYDKARWSIDFQGVVKLVVDPMNLSTGYEVDIGEKYHICTESKIRRGLLGGASVDVTHEHLDWLREFSSGGVRSVFKHNVWSERQLANIESSIETLRPRKIGNLNYVQTDA